MSLPEVFLKAPIAHRGYHDAGAGCPENTLAAFRAAIAAGYGIEMDIQPSAEGVPVVFHDDDLERLTGHQGRVAERPLAELQAMRVLGSAETVPTLRQVLDEVAGRAPLLIEVKDQDPPLGTGVGALEAEVARVLRGYRGPVALMSFNPNSVAALAREIPSLPRGITTCSYAESWWDPMPEDWRARLRQIPDYERTGSVFVSHEARDLGNPRIAELKREGAAILCWTIRSAEDEARARQVADNVTFEGYAAKIAP